MKGVLNVKGRIKKLGGYNVPHSHRPNLKGEYTMKKTIILPTIRLMDIDEPIDCTLETCRMEFYADKQNAVFERSNVGTYTILAMFLSNTDKFQLNLYDRNGYLKAVLRENWLKIGPLDGEGANLLNRLAQVFYRK